MKVEENNNLNNNMSLVPRLDATFLTLSSLVTDTAATANSIMINTPCTNIQPTKTPIQDIFLSF
jgi:hypothetical protein